ncbi:unnamed protein product [Zymoseptoria tritici ST99CH_3D7]|uniref:Uncharacterized protein n=1 Tax=Zymoseptoria tritici (strain ST99CH_3D7) TaxID=1276538 RepID=A0A1X7S3X0_ZYMT9|nr:unnamed protein product [Zymoseptoria tritici ST99CH_3D7]
MKKNSATLQIMKMPCLNRCCPPAPHAVDRNTTTTVHNTIWSTRATDIKAWNESPEERQKKARQEMRK